jgi:hypothetical protein
MGKKKSPESSTTLALGITHRRRCVDTAKWTLVIYCLGKSRSSHTKTSHFLHIRPGNGQKRIGYKTRYFGPWDDPHGALLPIPNDSSVSEDELLGAVDGVNFDAILGEECKEKNEK